MHRNAVKIILLTPFFAALGLSNLAAQSAAKNSAQQESAATLPAESLSISQDEVRSLEVPFEISACQSSSRCVKILKTSGRKIEIQGIEPGTSDVLLSSQSVSKTFKVSVTNPLASIYRDLQRDIADFSEVSVEMSRNAITLRGEISNYSRYVAFKNILDKYRDSCRNYVSYKPGPEMFESLKKQLTLAWKAEYPKRRACWE